jgi:hypothetical protein
MQDLAIVVPGMLGTLCLLEACAVYLRRQGFGQGGALLSLCGLALLGVSYWQAGAPDRAGPDLSRRLDAIAAALARLEAQIAEIDERQAELAVAQRASSADPDAATSPAGTAPATSPAETASAAGQDDDAPLSPILEIEIVSGVSEAELAAIVAWVREIKAEHWSSRISIEPVMPLRSTDSDGQRTRLMTEAGRVIDHVFVVLRQRVDIGSLVSEDVPKPRLRLGGRPRGGQRCVVMRTRMPVGSSISSMPPCGASRSNAAARRPRVS